VFAQNNESERFKPEGYVFKLYPLFVALFVVIQLECIIFIHKQIDIFDITTTLSGITFPINLLILAIVTHCYGKQSARQLIWINNIIILQFVGYTFFAHSMNWAGNVNNAETIMAFDQLLPLFMRSGLAGLVAENIAEFIFIAMYNKHKNKAIVRGANAQGGLYQFYGLFKYCFVANLLMLLVSYVAIFWHYPFYDILILVLQVLALKSVIEAIFSPLAIVLIAKIKKFEGFEIHDFSGNNPFLFLLDYKNLNFNQVNAHENHTNK
jgi:uncharacterized PurR-regulated membrane protein YhhQ (DUF165 family)